MLGTSEKNWTLAYLTSVQLVLEILNDSQMQSMIKTQYIDSNSQPLFFDSET